MIKGDGEISFKEFSNVMGDHFYRKYSPEEIRVAFNQFDKDKSGFITANELKDVLSKMGRNYSKEEIANMIKSVDQDGNGKISIEEFSRLLN